MESNFRSTVLQRHPDDDERDRERQHRRDVMNPTPTHRHSTFSLRSPTHAQAEFHPPPYASPNNAGSTHQSPSRPPPLHNRSPYMSSTAPVSGGPAHPLPPPAGLAPSSSSSVGHHNSASPLHPRPHTILRLQQLHRRILIILAINQWERRISDSWHNAPQVATPKHQPREPYQYPQPVEQQHQSSYYNGNYSSPRARTSSFNRPPSPLSHSHPNLPAGSISPLVAILI
ncbi:hypothetical protein PT974_04398 [Cladobotryum mycophilum]|uniref:Uncharacterized protein n=1 Tax=Cladobotryum mycophilum TaxID=491253 RepID=A0ABR0SUZ8_9HYPO